MKVFTGETGDSKVLGMLKEHGIGRLFTTQARKLYEGEKWGFDNGAFSAWRNNYRWDGDAYLERLEKFRRLGFPYMAVIPDKPAQHDSLEFSLIWLEELPDDWPWYLALQDNMSYGDVSDVLKKESKVKGLFLGGSDYFKMKWAKDYCNLAHECKKKFHYARTSSIPLLVYANEIGADSCDSTFWLWKKTRMEALCRLIKDNFKTKQMKLIGSYVVDEVKPYEQDDDCIKRSERESCKRGRTDRFGQHRD
jgi:hypothetical protein